MRQELDLGELRVMYERLRERPSLRAQLPAEAALPEGAADDVAQIQYTSGTTGFPQGAELHHRGLTNNARFWAERMELRPGEAYVNPMPLFHAAGCGMGVLGAAQRPRS